VEILKYLVSIKANIMCRDRFNGTPLEDAVRHRCAGCENFYILFCEKILTP
jgi:hypothetical protein